MQEKQKKDEERKEAIKEAIEIAEKEARLQKTKLKLMKQQNNDLCNVNNDNEKNDSREYPVINKRNSANIRNNSELVNLTPKETNTTHIKLCNENKEEKEHLNNNAVTKIDNRNTNLCIKNNLDPPSCSGTSQICSNESKNSPTKTLDAQKCEPIALVIPSNPETLQHFQYAVLMPVPSSNSIPIAIPLSLTSEQNIPNSVTSTRTENRILTPSQYRQPHKLLCDSSTQTEDFKSEKYNREKNTNVEANYDNRSRKGRSNSRNENVSDRPKWGANRPPTRYMKQSEKDPLYQRKKMRQRMQTNMYDDKNSSDESHTGTPRFRKKIYMGKRQTRPLWRKYDHDEIFKRNIRMYQSEIVPIRTDKDHVCLEHKCCCICRCTGEYHDDQKVDILKIEHESYEHEQDIIAASFDSNIEDHNRGIDALPSIRLDILKQDQCSLSRIHSSNSKSSNF
ncbi:hypothetical protein WA026_017472 [Henosepilachna vigintioctopunctata]|uniref:Uncharacterized protein n=1 Tax=Henosepilachna vigintioctopunctata TaxID=420089 RepID=A0AAW1VGZ9_9CUCU